MKFISPNSLQAEAIKAYNLDKNKTWTDRDWQLLVNYWAANIASGMEHEVCKIMAMLYECPLPDWQIEKIAAFQAAKKGERDDLPSNGVSKAH